MRRRGRRATALAAACLGCLAAALLVPGPAGDGPLTARGGAEGPPGLPGGEAGEGAVSSSPDGFMADLDAAGGPSAAATWSCEEGPAAAAAEVLEAYAAAGGCELLADGYLGITDTAWGAIVRGDMWVDAVYVTRSGDAARVRVARTWATDADG